MKPSAGIVNSEVHKPQDATIPQSVVIMIAKRQDELVNQSGFANCAGDQVFFVLRNLVQLQNSLG
jgi:hypothetical protein